MDRTAYPASSPASVRWSTGYPGLVWTLAFCVALIGVLAGINAVVSLDRLDMIIFGSIAIIAAACAAHGLCAVVDWVRIGRRNGKTTAG